MRLAVVGGDAAGMSAAAVARRRDASLEVLVLERGPYTSYSACGIPYLIGGLIEGADHLIARSPDEHRQAGIDVRTLCEVTDIDLAARTLTYRDTTRAPTAVRASTSWCTRPAQRRLLHRCPGRSWSSRCVRSTRPSASSCACSSPATHARW